MKPTKEKSHSSFKFRNISNHNRISTVEERFLNSQNEINNGVALTQSQEEEVELKIKSALANEINFENRMTTEYDGHDYSVIAGWFSIYTNEQNGFYDWCPIMRRENFEPRDPTHKFRKLGKEWSDFSNVCRDLQKKYPYSAAKVAGYFDIMKAGHKIMRESKALKRKAKKETNEAKVGCVMLGV